MEIKSLFQSCNQESKIENECDKYHAIIKKREEMERIMKTEREQSNLGSFFKVSGYWVSCQLLNY